MQTGLRGISSLHLGGIFSARRLGALAAILLLIGAVLCSVQRTTRSILLEEVRFKTRQLAQLLASQIEASEVEAIQSPADMDLPAFKSLLKFLQLVRKSYEDIAFIYILRPDPDTGEWRFVIDAQPYDIDLNEDGSISPEEEGVQPGTVYEKASELPEIAQGLRTPTARRDFYTDYYGTFMSGYAPIRATAGGTGIAVLAVDVKESTFQSKYHTINLAALAAFFVLGLGSALLLSFYYSRTDALDIIRRLDGKIRLQNSALQEKNDTLEDVVSQLRYREEEMGEELQLAQEVQQRFLPHTFPLQKELRFAATYQSCERIGGDLYDVFDFNERVAGIYIADVSGHGVSAALVTAALKASVERYRHRIHQTIHESLKPCEEIDHSLLQQFMKDLDGSIHEILLPGHFVTFLIALFNLETGRLLLGNAGHQRPILWEKTAGQAREIEVPANVAIGFLESFEHETLCLPLSRGDKLILYTDGLTERRNPDQEEFGEDRLVQTIGEKGRLPPEELLNAISHEAKVFASGVPAHDDYAIVIMEWLEKPEQL